MIRSLASTLVLLLAFVLVVAIPPPHAHSTTQPSATEQWDAQAVQPSFGVRATSAHPMPSDGQQLARPTAGRRLVTPPTAAEAQQVSNILFNSFNPLRPYNVEQTKDTQFF